ncbi:hypothetical protein [Glycomyces tarimensis]
MPERIRVLWRIGRRIAAESDAAALRRAMLAVAVACLVLGSVAATAVLVLDSARDRRADGSGLFYANEAAASEEVTLISTTADSVGESRQYGVIYVDPLGSESPLPPGLPEAGYTTGDVFLSPELRRWAPHVAERYGTTLKGTISPEGLADPGELLVIAIAELDDLSRVSSVVGDDSPASTGSEVSLHTQLVSQDFVPTSISVLLLGLVIVPAMLLLIVAARVGGQARDRRLMVLTVLGARRKDRRWIVLAESAGPLALGVALACVLVLPFLLWDLRLPFVGYLVSSDDLRGGLWMLSLAAAGAVVLSLLIAAAGAYAAQSREHRTRPKARQSIRVPWLWTGLFAVAIVGAVVLPSSYHGGRQFYTMVWLTTFTVIITVAPMVTALTYWIARRAARAADGRDRPVTTLIARRVMAAPKPFGRPLAIVTMANLLIILIATLQGLLGEAGYKTKQWLETSTRSMVVVHGAGNADIDSQAQWRQSLPERLEVLGYGITETETPTEPIYTLQIYADCDRPEPQTECEREMGPSELANVLSAIGNADVMRALQEESEVLEVETAVLHPLDEVDPAQARVTYLVFDPEEGRVDSEAVKSAGSVLPAGAQVLYPREEQVLGTIPNIEQSRWVTGIGAIGASILGLAMTVAFSTVFGREARRLAPLSMLTGDRTVYRKLAIGSVALPIMLAMSAGLVIGQVATTAMRRYIESSATIPWTTSLILVNMAAALIVSVWAASAVLRYRDHWKPSNN